MTPIEKNGKITPFPGLLQIILLIVVCLLLASPCIAIDISGTSNLVVTCSANPTQLTTGQQGQLTVAATINGNPVPGAQVSLSSSFLQLSPSSGVTDSSGIFRSMVTAPSGVWGTDRISANAVYKVPTKSALLTDLKGTCSVEILSKEEAPITLQPQPQPQPQPKPLPPVPGPSGSPPVLVATASPLTGSVPLAVSFDASGSYDPDGTISGYTWNFADGKTASGKLVTHTYTKAGVYRASVTATDNTGISATSGQIRIEVKSPVTEIIASNVTKSVTGKIPESTEMVRGDMNQDSYITSADALAILKMAAGSTPPDFAGDVDNDNQITTDDARRIMRESLDSNLPPPENIAVIRRDMLEAIKSSDAGSLIVMANKNAAGSDAPTIKGMVVDELGRNPAAKLRSGAISPDAFDTELRTNPRVIVPRDRSIVDSQIGDVAGGGTPRVLEKTRCDQIAASGNTPRITSVSHFIETTTLSRGTNTRLPQGTGSWAAGSSPELSLGTGIWLSGSPDKGPLLTSSLISESILPTSKKIIKSTYTFSEGDVLEVTGDWFGCYAGTEKVCQGTGRCSELQKHNAVLEMQYQPRSEFDPVRTIMFRLEPAGGSWDKAWFNNSILIRIPDVIEDPELITALEDENTFHSRIRLEQSSGSGFPVYSDYFDVVLGTPSVSEVYSKPGFSSPEMTKNLSVVVSGQPVIITGQNFGTSPNGRYGQGRVELELDSGALLIENYEYEKRAEIKTIDPKVLRTTGRSVVDQPVSDLSAGSGWYYYRRLTTTTSHSSLIALDIVSWNNTVIVAQAEHITGNYNVSAGKIRVYNPNRKVPSGGKPVDFLPRMVVQQITGEVFYKFNKESSGDHYEIIEQKDANGTPLRILHAVHVTGGCPGKDGDDLFFEYDHADLPKNVAITAEILHGHNPGEKDFLDYLNLGVQGAYAIYQASEGAFGPLVAFGCEFSDYPEICTSAGTAAIECITMNWVSCAFNLGKLVFHVFLQIFSDFAGKWWVDIHKCTGEQTGVHRCVYNSEDVLSRFYIWIDWNSSCTGKNKNEPCIYDAMFYVVAPEGVNLGR